MQKNLCESRKDFQTVLEDLKPGDWIRVESLACAGENTSEILRALTALHARGGDLISLEEGIDTRNGQGEAFFALCAALLALDGTGKRRRDGIEKARAEGRYKGRKPITVDDALFDTVVARWKGGEISARQAMAELGLKPNTFYRRIKEQEELKMKDYKKTEHELRAELKEAARQSRQDLGDLKKQVREEARELKKAAAEKPALHEMEREIRKDRVRAEAEHHDSLRRMKKDVEAETKELKKLLEEQEGPKEEA